MTGGQSFPAIATSPIEELADASRQVIHGASLRVDSMQEGILMDLASFLAVAVLLLIVLSGYFLFNDVPTFGGSGSRRRR